MIYEIQSILKMKKQGNREKLLQVWNNLKKKDAHMGRPFFLHQNSMAIPPTGTGLCLPVE
jgi:hypothetical protein